VFITIIIALLFPNLRLMLCQIFSNDFPKIRNLLKIFLRSFENVAPGYNGSNLSKGRTFEIAIFPLLFWHVPLGVGSAKHRQQSPQWMILIRTGRW